MSESVKNNKTFVRELAFYDEAAFNTITSEGDVFNCFRLILGRLPKREEWTRHSMAAGHDLSTVVRPYLNSLEFANRGMMQEKSTGDIELVTLDEFSIYVSPGDLAVGAVIQQTRNYEPHISNEFRRVLRPGMTVLDVGANIGYYTMLAASAVGKEGCCLAVEPNVHNVKLLAASKEVNGFECINIFQGAATNQWGLLYLNTSHSNGVISRATGKIGELMSREIVMGMKLDNLLGGLHRLDVIKIDVEGAEHLALSGAIGAIERFKPIIFSEFSPPAMPGISGVSPEVYLGLFLERGYEISVLSPDSKADCRKDASKVMDLFKVSGTDHIDILAMPVA